MATAYLDCSAGISGDMFLGALVDAGVPLKEIEKGLGCLSVRGYSLEAKRVKRATLACTKVDVVQAPKVRGRMSETRRWADIKDIIDRSSLPPHIKQRGMRIFRRLFEAEGKIHGKAYHRTHLHELGAVDCIVDIFGTLLGIDRLGVTRIYSSALNLGSGSVRTEHGMLPVPAPATAEILAGMPVYSSGIPFELTTPTGAAIVREIAEASLYMPLIKVERIGYGAGQRELEGFPNALRILLGEEIGRGSSAFQAKVTVVETNIDDMNPQLYEYVMNRLFRAGALDVYLTQVIMKKGRPGVVLTALCREEKRADIADILFRETTTIGVRFYEASRIALEREVGEVTMDFGKVRVKMSRLDDDTVTYSPEYEDCRRIAKRSKVPLREVMRLAQVRCKKK